MKFQSGYGRPGINSGKLLFQILIYIILHNVHNFTPNGDIF